MAQKVTVQLVDDVDGGKADSTVEFALDGVSYAIDLSAGNAATLRDALADFFAAGRRTGGRKRVVAGSKASSATKATPERNQAIRDWAHQHGIQVAARGRIPAHVVEQYDSNGR